MKFKFGDRVKILENEFFVDTVGYVEDYRVKYNCGPNTIRPEPNGHQYKVLVKFTDIKKFTWIEEENLEKTEDRLSQELTKVLLEV